MKKWLIIGILLWFVGSEQPTIFPDADSIRVREICVLLNGEYSFIKILTIHDHGKLIYKVPLDKVKALRVGSKLL